MHPLARPLAFTLVELLVVVAIIVVLLSLLAPALDKAIYQAELASCGARQKVVSTAFTAYAMDQRRYYPYRQAVHNPDTGVWPTWMAVPPGTVNKSGRTFDDRPMLRPYVAINAFNEPLTKGLDLDTVPPDQGISITTTYWASWIY